MQKITSISTPIDSEPNDSSVCGNCAQLVDVNNSGVLHIELDGIRREAQLLSHLVATIRGVAHKLPVSVLVANINDTTKPVIIGVIETKMTLDIGDSEPSGKRLTIDGKKLLISAHTEIELRCGTSSIKMTKDGKIVIKGNKIVSRAAQVNKVKGATVQIN